MFYFFKGPQTGNRSLSRPQRVKERPSLSQKWTTTVPKCTKCSARTSGSFEGTGTWSLPASRPGDEKRTSYVVRLYHRIRVFFCTCSFGIFMNLIWLIECLVFYLKPCPCMSIARLKNQNHQKHDGSKAVCQREWLFGFVWGNFCFPSGHSVPHAAEVTNLLMWYLTAAACIVFLLLALTCVKNRNKSMGRRLGTESLEGTGIETWFQHIVAVWYGGVWCKNI